MKIDIAKLEKLGYHVNTSFNGESKNICNLTEIRIEGTHEVFTDSAAKSLRKTLAETGIYKDQFDIVFAELCERVADIQLFNSILGRE